MNNVEINKNFLEEKKIELGKKDYVKFLIEESVEKRKREILEKNKNKFVIFNDWTNVYLSFNINYTKLKNLESHFNLVIVGNFTKNLEVLQKSLELFLLGKAVLLKGKFEYLSFFEELKDFYFVKEDLARLIHYLPVFYYNLNIRYGVTENSVSLTYNENEFLLGKFDLNNDLFKEKLYNFLSFFDLNYLIRKGKNFVAEVNGKKIISTKDDVIVDTEIRIINNK